MDIFTAVIFDDRSIVPDATRTFSTLERAKKWVEGTTSQPGWKWEEWEEGKFVFGYGNEDIDEPIAAVYGAVLDEEK